MQKDCTRRLQNPARIQNQKVGETENGSLVGKNDKNAGTKKETLDRLGGGGEKKKTRVGRVLNLGGGTPGNLKGQNHAWGCTTFRKMRGKVGRDRVKTSIVEGSSEKKKTPKNIQRKRVS